jgi:hypothetical protein
MAAAARVLPLRALRLPRRHPTTLRSVPTREASGAPAPAAPPPSSTAPPAPPAGAPPATPPGAGAPPGPPSPLPESGERVRVREEAPTLSQAHCDLIREMAFAVGRLDAVRVSTKSLCWLAKEMLESRDPGLPYVAQKESEELSRQVQFLGELLTQVCSLLTGLDPTEPLAEHAAMLGRLAAHTGNDFSRDEHLRLAAEAFNARPR